MQKTAHEIYSFDEFRLDLTRGSLFRGDEELKLRPQSFDVLKYLTQNQGRLVSKDELIGSVWQGMAVTDDSLVQCMKDIRHALGDETQRIIKTVPRRGYIFEKEVTENGSALYVEETSGVHLVIEESEETNGRRDENLIAASPRLRVSASAFLGAVKRHKFATALALASIVFAGGGLAYGLFLFSRRPPGSPFKSVSIKQLTHEGNATTTAISRDGKYFAYTTGNEDGKQSLWVSQVVAPNPTQIVASADIQGLGSFSPDGNFVYYLRGDGMYQTATFGGSTRKMRDGVGGRFSISPDGKQVVWMRMGTGDGLGSRVIVANTDGTGEEQVIAYRKPPESFTTGGCGWSPDGETLICAAGDNPMFGQQFPMALRISDGQQTPLTPSHWNLVSYPQWLPDGSGFLMRAWNSKNPGATFWHVTFPGGVATPVYHSLDNYGQISLTADAKAFVTIQFKSQLNIYAMDLSNERRQMKQLTFGPDGVDGSRSLTTTPDNRIVYNSAKGGNNNLWIMDSDGGNQRQLTFDASLEDGAMVSRDGRSVVFGVPSQGIWKIDLDGGNRKQLTQHGMFPEYSPDGKWVFYTLPREKWSMWKVPAEGGEPVRVTDWPAAQPVVSPDGKLLAYVFSTSFTDHKLYVVPVEGGDPIRIFDWQPDNLFDLEWTPDGKSIVYAANENGVKEFFRQPLDGGEPQIFLIATGEFKNVGATTFSRDGKQLIYSAGDGKRDAVMFSLER